MSTHTVYCVLLGMLHCMPLRLRWEAAIGATRGAASLSTRTVYCELLGLLHCMPLRPR